jgi:hypothetical protein
MREFMELDLKGPARLGAVLDAVVRLSTYDEAALLELASSGALTKAFPFVPSAGERQFVGADFQTLESLAAASPLPLTDAQREELIRSSIPVADASRSSAKSAT